MACKYCEERGKVWNGDDPQCAFDHNGDFTTDNWMCGTMNKLREIAEEMRMSMRDDLSAGSGGIVMCDNDYAPYSYDGLGGYIAMAWYKMRGRTPTAVFLHEGETPIPITFDHAEMAIKTYNAIKGGDSQ